jgi:hypothetical protein
MFFAADPIVTINLYMLFTKQIHLAIVKKLLPRVKFINTWLCFTLI